MSVVLPYNFTAGTKIKASEVNANFSALAGKFTEGSGGIADGDISTSAAIKGSKISNVVGQRIPFDRIEDGAVTTAKIETSVSGSTGVTTAKIANQAVTGAKIAPGTILTGNMKYNLHQQIISQSVLAHGAGDGNEPVTFIFTPTGGTPPGNISTHQPIHAWLSNLAAPLDLATDILPHVVVQYSGAGAPSYVVRAIKRSTGYTLGATINFLFQSVA